MPARLLPIGADAHRLPEERAVPWPRSFSAAIKEETANSSNNNTHNHNNNKMDLEFGISLKPGLPRICAVVQFYSRGRYPLAFGLG